MKKLKVGQKVIALRPIWSPGLGEQIATTGDEGEIVRVGPDSQFGWALVQFRDSSIFLSVAPVYRQNDAHTRVK